jgi:peptidoglycan/LPS O-acetylase OafA/YrhL
MSTLKTKLTIVLGKFFLLAIAVLSVFFFHAGFSLFPGGFVGVDVFFVLSGYLMTSIIRKETQAKTFTIHRFYERRARRIIPMLLFTIAISYFPAYLFMVNSEFKFFTKSALYSSLGVTNILYSTTTNGVLANFRSQSFCQI